MILTKKFLKIYVVPVTVAIASSFLYLLVWAVMAFDPQEITEWQTIPLILQGDTDMGGSNIFAAYTLGHILFGMLGCIALTRLLNYRDEKKETEYLQQLVFIVSLLVICFYGNWSFLGPSREDTYGFPQHFIQCEYLQVLILFLVTSFCSVIWIYAVRATVGSMKWRIMLAPLMFFLLVWFSVTGITPKAGQILTCSQVPAYKANSGRHALLLGMHRRCMQWGK